MFYVGKLPKTSVHTVNKKLDLFTSISHFMEMICVQFSHYPSRRSLHVQKSQ